MTVSEDHKPKILAIANQKGGVGKTTTAVNLSCALSMLGKKVLLIDCDSQANATTCLGLNYTKVNKTIYHAIAGIQSIEDVIDKTMVEGLYIVPANRDLAGLEVEIASIENREQLLKNTIKNLTGFDYVLLDCPPSLGLITINALVAASSIIIPLQCEYLALEGLTHLIKTIRLVKQNFNPNLYIEGILLTMYDQRIRLSQQIAQEIQTHFKDVLYKTQIPKNVRLSEAPSFGKPIFLYDPKCAGADAYMNLAKEFIERIEGSDGKH